MSVFNQLAQNNGTMSSALGKELATRILSGESAVLDEVLPLCSHGLPDEALKNIRAGAAKAVEIAAERNPEMIAPHLQVIFPALAAPEPQTRWMVFRTYGFCASLVPSVAEQVIPYAKHEIGSKTGMIVASSADLFLGEIGAVSRKYAKIVYPILLHSAETVMKNEQDWILEAFTSLASNLTNEEIPSVTAFARNYSGASRKSTAKRAEKLLQSLDRS